MMNPVNLVTVTAGAKIIDGRQHARHLREALRVKAADLLTKFGAPPKLTVILVGDDAPSRLYVANKSRACRDVGIESVVITLPASTPLDTLLAVIEEQNRDGSVHGILVQLPLPPHLPVHSVLERIAVEKDVDGFPTPRRAIWRSLRFLRTSWSSRRANPISSLRKWSKPVPWSSTSASIDCRTVKLSAMWISRESLRRPLTSRRFRAV